MRVINELIGDTQWSVHENMPRQEYDRLPGLNATSICKARPRHGGSMLALRHQYLYGCEQTAAQAFGVLCHALVFEPETVSSSFVVWRGGRRQGKEWDAFAAANEYATIVLPEDWALAHEIRDAVTRQVLPLCVLKGGAELTIAGSIEGLRVKGRVDYLADNGVLYDLKICKSIAPRDLSRACGDYGWHLRLGWYRELLRRAGREVSAVKIIAVENGTPLDISVVSVPEYLLVDGFAQCQEICWFVRCAIASDSWTGRDWGECYSLEVPEYQLSCTSGGGEA